MSASYAALEEQKGMTLKLLEYCGKNDWAGYDPYDVLNSRILKRIFFMNSRLPRLALTQLMKRNPINFRKVLLVPKTQNPKAIALFLMALQKLWKLRMLDGDQLVGMMADKLIALRSPDPPYSGWGYSFPWQTRIDLVPRGTPNLVCTTFAANALLNVFDENHDSRCLTVAIEASELILNHLYWTDSGGAAGFAYPLPSIRTITHNANFLGAALLCRVFRYTGEEKFLLPALKVARYSATKQNDDGSWYYGELSTQRWIDNFHTGYNLLALRDINQYCGTTEFNPHIETGFNFYKNHFFRDDGAPKYFHDRTYPIDIHCVAQSLITLISLADLDDCNIDLAHSIIRWAYIHMWDERGYFYYQVHPLYTNKISYMRWSQAWMLLALSYFLEGIAGR